VSCDGVPAQRIALHRLIPDDTICHLYMIFRGLPMSDIAQQWNYKPARALAKWIIALLVAVTTCDIIITSCDVMM
jgi:hypothetical protein